MAKRRFVAPARDAVSAQVFDHPVFSGYAAFWPWLDTAAWPSLDAMNAALALHGGRERFVRQDAALLADGLHFEQRIAQRGEIATRAEDWHDLFNALVWIEHTSIKRALNARQVTEIARMGPRERSRAQCALTHFDEAGVVVVLRDAALLDAWDRHDWHALFWREREAWRDGRIELVVFGHASLEYMLLPMQVATAKAIAVVSPANTQHVLASLATGIADGELLDDPQELRPLPLSGIRGWHPLTEDEAFYRDAPCFRPLREGRTYPPARRVAAPCVATASDQSAIAS